MCFAPARGMAKLRKQTHEEIDLGETTATVPDRDRIAQRAYELYQARGGEDGRAMDDWLDAERELNQRPDVATEH